MSWNITIIGKPENVSTALSAESEKISGQSKIEYDAALPHLQALVKETFGDNTPLVKLEASGHGMATADKQVMRQLSVSIQPIYGNIV